MDSNDHTMENNKVMSAPLFSPSASSSTIRSLPPGFRFRPTDEELIVHYLQQKVHSLPLPAFLIAEINLYMYNPWELPNKALFGEDEWYFFSPIYRKYPNGERPNRAAGSGYWKATGTDRSIVLSDGSDQIIGVKKALVFYKGRPPKGTKTDWTMSEYRITDTSSSSSNAKSSVFKKSMRLDDWVLCRVRRRGNLNQLMGGEDHNYPSIVTPKAREENYYYPYTSQQASNMSDYMSMQHLFRDSQVMSSLLIGEYRNRSPNQSPNSEEAPFSTIPKNVSSIINNYIDKNHNNNSGARYDFQGFNNANASGWMLEEDMNSPNTPVPVWEKNNGVESIILEDHTYHDNHPWDNETESDELVIDQQYQTMYDNHGNMSSYDSTGFLLNF